MRALILMLVLIAMPAFATKTVVPGNTPVNPDSLVRFQFVSGDAGNFTTIAHSCGAILVGFEAATGGAATVTACSDQSCTSTQSLVSLSADTMSSGPYRSAWGWLRVSIDTAPSAGTAEVQVRCGQEIASSDAFRDFDGDGKWEVAEVYDADGDGSTYTTCTAKDAPFPQCKIAGHVIYPDTIDDINTMIHQGLVSKAATINLRDGVDYILFGCWDIGAWQADPNTPAAVPSDTSINDPREESRRDASGDASKSDCANDQYGNPIWAMVFQDWQGTIQGAGIDTRENETGDLAAGWKPKGSRLVNDTGRKASLWYDSGADMHSLMLGFVNRGSTGTNGGTGAFNEASTDSKGFGELTDTVDVEDSVGFLCLCNNTGSCNASSTDWTAGLAIGDLLAVESAVSSSSTKVTASTMTVDTAPPYALGSCSAGSVEVLVGVHDGTSGTNTVASYARELVSGGIVGNPTPEFWNGRTRFKDLTITSQDSWNESGGDCSETGIFSNAADSSSSDEDCDTSFFFHFGTGGIASVENIATVRWHVHPYDAGTVFGEASLDQVQGWYGQGGILADITTNWRMTRTLIESTIFEDTVFSAFGSNNIIEDFVIRNSEFDWIYNFTYTRGTTFRFVEMENNVRDVGFVFGSGAENNTLEFLRETGHAARRTSGNGEVVRFVCASGEDTIRSNLVKDVLVDVTGFVFGSSYPSTVFLDEHPDEFINECIRGNTFQNIRRYARGDITNGASLFCSDERATGTPRNSERP